jgi:hypothetical protein
VRVFHVADGRLEQPTDPHRGFTSLCGVPGVGRQDHDLGLAFDDPMLDTFRDVRLLVQILVASLKSVQVLRIIARFKKFAVASLQRSDVLTKLLHQLGIASEQGICLAL